VAPLTIVLLDWQRAVARSDPYGMRVAWEASGPSPVRHIEIDTIGDDEPPWSWTYDLATDGRGVRGFSVKPVREGTWPIVVRAMDDRGCIAETSSGPTVTVVR
jgi:hypothetical protein